MARKKSAFFPLFLVILVSFASFSAMASDNLLVVGSLPNYRGDVDPAQVRGSLGLVAGDNLMAQMTPGYSFDGQEIAVGQIPINMQSGVAHILNHTGRDALFAPEEKGMTMVSHYLLPPDEIASSEVRQGNGYVRYTIAREGVGKEMHLYMLVAQVYPLNFSLPRVGFVSGPLAVNLYTAEALASAGGPLAVFVAFTGYVGYGFYSSLDDLAKNWPNVDSFWRKVWYEERMAQFARYAAAAVVVLMSEELQRLNDQELHRGFVQEITDDIEGDWNRFNFDPEKDPEEQLRLWVAGLMMLKYGAPMLERDLAILRSLGGRVMDYYRESEERRRRRDEENEKKVILIIEDNDSDERMVRIMMGIETIPEDSPYEVVWVKRTDELLPDLYSYGQRVAVVILDGNVPPGGQNEGWLTKELVDYLVLTRAPVIGNSDSQTTQNLMRGDGRLFYVCSEKNFDLDQVDWSRILRGL